MTKRQGRSPVTEAEAFEATRVLQEFRTNTEGVSHAKAIAAQRTINAYVRQHEAATRAEAKRLGIKGNPVDYLRKKFLKGGQ